MVRPCLGQVIEEPWTKEEGALGAALLVRRGAWEGAGSGQNIRCGGRAQVQIHGNQGGRRTRALPVLTPARAGGPGCQGARMHALKSTSTPVTQSTFTPPLSYWPAFFQLIKTKSESLCKNSHTLCEPVGCLAFVRDYQYLRSLDF